MLKFSLIICSRGRPRLIERALAGVGTLRYPAFELIVVLDPEDSETANHVALSTPNARVGNCDTANLAKARNIGLAMARGDIVAFLDDDAVPEPDWLDRLADAYADYEVTAAGGFIRAANGVKFQYRVALIDAFGADHRRSRVPSRLTRGYFLSLTGTNFSVRRAAALALRGFDETYAYFLEETDFMLRLQQAGGQVCIVPEAQVHHGYAANEFRQENGVPKSMRSIALSKSYFCHINRQTGTQATAITNALEIFRRKKRRQIKAHLKAGRLGADAALRLLEELQTGFEEGELLANRGRALPPIAAVASAEFVRYLPPRQVPLRQRLCVLMKGASVDCPQWPIFQALAAAGHEVTVISLGAAKRHCVTFNDGIWEHRLAMRWYLPRGLSEYAVRAELQRISGRRCFEKIHVASNDAMLERVAAICGLPRFTPVAM